MVVVCACVVQCCRVTIPTTEGGKDNRGEVTTIVTKKLITKTIGIQLDISNAIHVLAYR